MAFFAEKYTPWIIDSLSGHKTLTWIIWNIVLPIILRKRFKNTWSESKGFNVAYSALVGCSNAVTCLFLLSSYFKIPLVLYSPTILAMSVAGYIAGYRLNIQDKYQDPYNDGLIIRTVEDFFFGIITGWIISSLFSDALVSIINFFSSLLFASIAHIIFREHQKALKTQAWRELESDRLKKMALLDEYDKKIRKFEEEKAARDQAAKEREARERAEKAQRKRSRAEQNYRNYQRNHHSESEKNNQQKPSFTNNTGNLHFFAGCENKTELKRRYRQLCKKLHPDCPGGNAESFRKMQFEYEQLLKTMAA